MFRKKTLTLISTATLLAVASFAQAQDANDRTRGFRHNPRADQAAPAPRHMTPPPAVTAAPRAFRHADMPAAAPVPSHPRFRHDEDAHRPHPRAHWEHRYPSYRPAYAPPPVFVHRPPVVVTRPVIVERPVYVPQPVYAPAPAYYPPPAPAYYPPAAPAYYPQPAPASYPDSPPQYYPEPAHYPTPAYPDSVNPAGAVVGAVIGGALGNAVSQGSGAGTAIGAVIGGLIGSGL